MNIDALKVAFGECKRKDTSICNLSTSYELLDCKEFFIHDDTKQDRHPVSIITDRNQRFQLQVVNESEELICVVKTDKCLFTDKHKNCDCILFNSNQVFLVEISEAKNRNAKRKDAIKQLGSTLSLLKEAGFMMGDYKSKAIICFRSGVSKPTQASNNSAKEQFREAHHVSLEEGNKITFDHIG